MAEINQIQPISRYDGRVLNLLQEEIIQNSFGDVRDFIEYHVYDLNGNLLLSNVRYDSYTLPENGTISSQNTTTEELNIDIEQDLLNAGFSVGSYKVVYNFFRKHVTTDADVEVENATRGTDFFIKEISSDRTELRLDSLILSQGKKLIGVSQLIDELNDAPYFEEFLLNFSENKQSVGINVQIDDTTDPLTILVKLLDPLPDEFGELSTCEIVEERSYQSTFEVRLDEEDLTLDSINLDDLGDDDDDDEDNLGSDGARDNIDDLINIDENININLSGRTNFNRSLNQNRYSRFYSFNDITSGSTATDFDRFLNYISSSKAEINVDFEDINNEFTSSFYNFVHFSSAKERLNNFKYKVQQIEGYVSSSASLAAITTPNLSEIQTLETQINEVKGNFDKYEKFLYYESSSKSWPKSNSTPPYVLYPSTSSQALIWLGNDSDQSIYYGGEILSASQYDNQNPHNLIYTLPSYLLDDYEVNENYFKFVHMTGQMFDELWLYIKALTDLYKNKNNLSDGISGDVVSDMLESLGFDVNNEELSEAQFYDFLLGNTQEGSIYITTGSGETLISSSNLGSLPKADIVQEKYKRLYHNLSYFYKTKGTLRGLKSLISSYGIPTDLISIEEVSTPSIDVGNTKQVDEKFYYSLNTNDSRVEIPWLPLQQNEIKDTGSLVPDAIEFMFNDRNNFNSGSYLFTVYQPTSSSFNMGLKIDKVNSVSASLTYFQGNSTASLEIPVYYFSGSEEGWWNVLVTKSTKRTPAQSGSSQTYTLYVKKKSGDHISHQFSSSFITSNDVSNSLWTEYDSSITSNVYTSSLLYLGSNSGSDYFSGSFMEFRYWSEPLSEDAFDQHVLNPESILGNSLYSSFNDLSLRLALGSDTVVYELSSSDYPTGFNGIDIS